MTGFTKILLAGTMLATSVFGAQAGGFSRGTADTDILFEQGNFSMRSGVTIVSPRRAFTDHYDPGLAGHRYTETYTVPSFAAKVNLFDPLSCAGTYVQAYGGDVNYEGRLTPGKVSEEFAVDEFALTCAVKFGVGPGNFYILGGVFQEQFNYDRVQDFSPAIPGALPTTLGLTGTDTGYRIGAAYDIPDIALRAKVLYRSGTSYGASGTLGALPAGAACLSNPSPLNPACSLPPSAALPGIPALGLGELPQSLEVGLQSGIAPGWLAFANIKWTDWSVMDTLDVVNAGTGAPLSQDLFFWRDGWTVTGGVGHAFNEQVSGLASLTWDRGVGTGYDLQSDTWTLALGASVKDTWGGELRGGVGISYLTSASAPFDTSTFAPPGAGVPSVGSDWSTAVSVGYKINW